MLLQRVLTALLLAPLAIIVILLPSTPWFALICAVVFVGALAEWLQLLGMRPGAAHYVLLAVAAGLFALLWFAPASALTLPLLIVGVVWWLAAGLWLRHFSFAAAPTRENRLLKLGAGVLVTFPAWIALVNLHGREPHGHAWTLLALMIVWAADIGAFFAGRTFGKRKLAPNISPGKTRAGAYGALVAGTALCLVGGCWLGVRGTQLIGLGVLALVTVAASIEGDLLESLMKRHAGAKDSGHLFPGHGGLLDRLDSVFAALPVFALGLRVLGI